MIEQRRYLVPEALQTFWNEIEDLEVELELAIEDLEPKLENEIKEDFIDYFVEANNGNETITVSADATVQGEVTQKKIENWNPVAMEWVPRLCILVGILGSSHERNFEKIDNKLENLGPTNPQELCKQLKGIALNYPEAKKIKDLRSETKKKLDQFQDDLENYFLKGFLKKHWCCFRK